MPRPLLLAASLLALAALPARADSCASVVPGARMGPSPTFNGWPWRDACYVSWPGGYIDGLNARLTYEPKCKAVPGYLHFEGDFGSNRNTCIFKAPGSGSETSAPPSPASGPPEQAARAALTDGIRKIIGKDWRAAESTLNDAHDKYSALFDAANSANNVDLENSYEYRLGIIRCLSLVVVFQMGIEKNTTSTSGMSDLKRICSGNMTLSVVRDNIAAIEAYHRSLEPAPQPAPASPPPRPLPAPIRPPPLSPQVALACLDFGVPKKVSSNCDFKPGLPMYRNMVRIDPDNPNCPEQFDVAYREPDSGRISTRTVSRRPSTFETCGGGVSSYSLKP